MNSDRNITEEIIQEIMYEQLIDLQKKECLSKRKMAGALLMDTRSYYDLEKRKKNCGLVTSILLCIKCSDRNALFDALKEKLMNPEEYTRRKK